MARATVPTAIDPADFRLRKEEHDKIWNEVQEHLARAREAVKAARPEFRRGPRRLGGATPPTNNMGGKGQVGEEREWQKLVCDDGEVKMIPIRRGWGGSSAFIDWINCTFHESTFMDEAKGAKPEGVEVVAEVSRACTQVFGFGITSKRETGANFYKMSYVLGDGYGLVCYGGQRNTVLIMLSGEGCTAAAPGWEQRLKHLLETGIQSKITRVDLAHDIYDGKAYGVDKAMADYEASRYEDGISYGFCSGGRIPDCEMRGNWKRPNGKGRTFYVGHRTNGKFARIYEKGRQLGCSASEWVRIEGEMKSVDRIIPFDVLTRPGEYLAALYPCFDWISTHQERILTTQKATEITYEKSLDWMKKQIGAYLFVAREVEGGAENLLEKLIRPVWPKRLRIPDFRFASDSPFLHQQPTPAMALAV